MNIGEKIYRLAEELFPICRSITGNGVRKTLQIIQGKLPRLKIIEVPSGQKVFDWEVPDEWNIEDAYIITPDGDKIAQFRENNLHVVGYSTPVNVEMDLDELDEFLFSLPDKPEWIPYVTSYYERRWGFCIKHSQRTALKSGKYRAVIDSKLEPGSLTYAELFIPGATDKEVFFSTYVCHPSLANNEVSGPSVATFVGKWLEDRSEELQYSYRIAFVPETIGSITYISKNLETLKRNVIFGINLTCVGDDRAYSYLSSRHGDSLADRVVQHVLRHTDPNYEKYTYLDRGSDERQYCAPGVDLPLCSLMRSKYGEYPEYHTSADDMQVISASGLGGSYEVIVKCIEILEGNIVPKSTVICEPQLGKRGLYNTLSGTEDNSEGKLITDLMSYSDGKNDLFSIAEIIDAPFWRLKRLVDELRIHNLIEYVNADG